MTVYALCSHCLPHGIRYRFYVEKPPNIVGDTPSQIFVRCVRLGEHKHNSTPRKLQIRGDLRQETVQRILVNGGSVKAYIEEQRRANGGAELASPDVCHTLDTLRENIFRFRNTKFNLFFTGLSKDAQPKQTQK